MKDYKKISNKNLVLLCINKDKLAWLEFVQRFGRLVSYAIEQRFRRWGYNYDPGDVADIRQEVFLSIWKRNLLAGLRRPETVTSWLAILSANKAVDFFKSRRRLPLAGPDLFGGDTLDSIASGGPGPLDELILNDSLKSITRIMEGLGPREKNVMKLKLLYGKNHAEIARMLNLPVGSVYSIVSRVRGKIERELKK